MHSWSTNPDFENEKHPASLPLFVYGSLRPKGERYDLIENLVVEEPLSSSVEGVLYYSHDRSYPVLVKGSKIVYGNTLVVKANKKLWKLLCSFELAWGYDLSWINLSSKTGKVLACTWPWDRYIGDEIVSGDWFIR